MNLKEIEALLQKFYDGETSLDEEASLRDYFSNENVPEQLIAHQAQFSFYQKAKDEKVPLRNFERDLSKHIREEKNVKQIGNRRRTFYFVTGIAASILIFIGVYFQFVVNDNRSAYSIENTYEDPEVAYAEAKKALLLVSEKFNTGVQDFNKFSTFSQYKELITRKN